MAERICGNCFAELKSVSGSCPHCGWHAAQEGEKYPMALPVGSILNGRYIVGRCLGQGGFGITYMAWDVQTQYRVAIKEFFPETMATRTGSCSVAAFSGQRQEHFSYGMQCFLAEAQTLSQFMGVQSIVQVYSYFEENGTAYFVMEYVEGTSLQAYLSQRKKLCWEETKRILLPVMDALEVVHSRGIIHRDVSPDNIYIASNGGVKLLDFGAARYSLGDRSRSLDVVLKVGYAPKEQYIRRGRQGPYTDIYSLAATFYFSLTGRLPPESVERMDADELILPSSLGSDIPEDAECALEKALAVQAADRYQNIADFRAGLGSVQEDAYEAPPPPEPELKPDEKEEAKDQVTIRLSRDMLKKLGMGAAVILIILLSILGSGGEKKKEKPQVRAETTVSAQEETTEATQSQPTGETKKVSRVKLVTVYKADGTVKNTSTREYTYNKQGRTISMKNFGTGDGAEDFEWQYKYDDEGNQVENKYFKEGKLTATYEYSDFVDGNYHTLRMVLPDSPYGSVSTYTYDKDGNMKTNRIKTDTYESLYEYFYDDDGNQISYTYEYYYQNAKTRYGETTYTYDANGDRISELEIIYGKDGKLESNKRTRHSYERDAEDYMLKKTTYRDDGTYEVSEYELVQIPIEEAP